MIALPMTDQVGARAAAERLRLEVKANIVEATDGERLPQVTISVGVAVMEVGESAQEFFTRADSALYRAKGAGRDRIEG